MGLTGKFWAHQYYDVVPDIIVFGKKSQGIYLLSILHSIISFFSVTTHLQHFTSSTLPVMRLIDDHLNIQTQTL